MLHWDGLIIALLTILIIGVFHPVVIKTEYYFGCKAWPVFLITGLFLIAGSLKAANTVLSAVLAVTGATCLWSIRELFEQRERVRKGWWPENPERLKREQEKKARRS